jgi:hypothetical protein
LCCLGISCIFINTKGKRPDGAESIRYTQLGKTMEFEFIDENDIQAVRRGRKSTAPAELVEALAKMPKGQAVRIKGMKLDPTSPDYKNDKASVSASIRSAGKLAGVKVAISWSPDGVPQVKTKVVRAKK